MALTAAQRVVIAYQILGGPKAVAQTEEMAAAMNQLGLATARTGAAMKTTTQHTWLQNQALFTMRRYAFYGTLAITGLGIAAVKMGWEFQSQMNVATVAIRGFTKSADDSKKMLKDMYLLAAETPFEFPDVILAARRLLPLFNRDVGRTELAVKTL